MERNPAAFLTFAALLLVCPSPALSVPFTLTHAVDGSHVLGSGRSLRARGSPVESTAVKFSFEFDGEEYDVDLEKSVVFSPTAHLILNGENGDEVKDAPETTTFTSDRCALTLVGDGFDALCARRGRGGDYVHFRSEHGGAHEMEVVEDEPQKHTCGGARAPKKPTLVHDGEVVSFEEPAAEHTHDHAHAHVHREGRSLEVKRWTKCYPNDAVTRRFSIGIAVGSKLYEKLGSAKAVADFVASVVAETNLVYRAQLNIVLTVGDLFIRQSAGGPAWNGCSKGLDTQLSELEKWTRPSRQGVWHLLDDCWTGGSIGYASIGTLCGHSWDRSENKKGGNGVSWISGNTFKTFAHEIGHNFGAFHSFENGRQQTGGLMDYGDGKLNGEYQFNTQFRKEEMCKEISRVVDTCEHFSAFEPKCGNGIVEDGETCECASGQTSCRFCSQCQLASGAACTPDSESSAQCCSSQGQFETSAKTCTTSSGNDGYCSAGGKCAEPQCSTFGFGAWCGMHADNGCKIKCTFNGRCDELNNWRIKGTNIPLNEAQKDTLCTTSDGRPGTCSSGVCGAVGPAVPTAKPTANPTANPTNLPTAKPTNLPTARPTKVPTAYPTKRPSATPTARPTKRPTPLPTKRVTPPPTKRVTKGPTAKPTARPTKVPTAYPTKRPSATPTARPTKVPTAYPTKRPSATPTARPTKKTAAPTAMPTARPMWTKCANEGEVCVCPSGVYGQVRFGQGEQWIVRETNGPILCGEQTFVDSLLRGGVSDAVKECQCRNDDDEVARPAFACSSYRKNAKKCRKAPSCEWRGRGGCVEKGPTPSPTTPPPTVEGSCEALGKNKKQCKKQSKECRWMGKKGCETRPPPPDNEACSKVRKKKACKKMRCAFKNGRCMATALFMFPEH